MARSHSRPRRRRHRRPTTITVSHKLCTTLMEDEITPCNARIAISETRCKKHWEEYAQSVRFYKEAASLADEYWPEVFHSIREYHTSNDIEVQLWITGMVISGLEKEISGRKTHQIRFFAQESDEGHARRIENREQKFNRAREQEVKLTNLLADLKAKERRREDQEKARQRYLAILEAERERERQILRTQTETAKKRQYRDVAASNYQRGRSSVQSDHPSPQARSNASSNNVYPPCSCWYCSSHTSVTTKPTTQYPESYAYEYPYATAKSPSNVSTTSKPRDIIPARPAAHKPPSSSRNTPYPSTPPDSSETLSGTLMKLAGIICGMFVLRKFGMSGPVVTVLGIAAASLTFQ